MKRLLLLPLLALPLLFMSCDGQVPTDPEAADPLFGKVVPNETHDYKILRMNVRYSARTLTLKVKVGFKNVSVVECSTRGSAITLFFRQVSPTLTGWALLQGATQVCDEPGGGGASYGRTFNNIGFIPGVAEIQAVIDDLQTGDADVFYREFTVR